jgi:hypothetical protein
VREPKLPRPLAAPLRGYPVDSSARDIATARRMNVTGELLSRRCGRVLGFTEAVAAEEEDLRVFDETIHDGSGDGGVEENVTPVREGSVGGDQ